MIHFRDCSPSPLAMAMVLWQLHSTVLVLDNDYYTFASWLSTQNHLKANHKTTIGT